MLPYFIQNYIHNIKFYNIKFYYFLNNLKNEIGEIEDVTKYGEFVSSYFAWLTLSKQKERAEDMDNMTKNNK